MLGEREYSDKFESKHFNEHVAHIREECKDDASTFGHLMENYHDKDYFSTDTDERIDKLVAFGYAGTTAMHSPMLSRTGSGSSEGSMNGAPPLVDPTDEPMDDVEKPPDLDKTVTMTDEMLETPQAEKTPVEEMSTGSKKKKSKQRRKAR